MPNWVKNELFVIGSKKNRNAVKALLANSEMNSDDDELVLDFNKVVRMPDGYAWTNSPANRVGKYANPDVRGDEPLDWQWSKDRNCGSLSDVEARIAERLLELGAVHRQGIDFELLSNVELQLLRSMLSVVLKRLHGFECWHDWAIAKWGTKWNAHNVKVRDANRVLRYHFLTAWTPPRPFVYALGKQCPDVTLVLESLDSGVRLSESLCVRNTHYVKRYYLGWPPPGKSELSVGSSTPPESNG